jgi:hypothetical protein
MPRVSWFRLSPAVGEEVKETQKPDKIQLLRIFQENTNLRKVLSIILIAGLFYQHYLVGIAAISILAFEYGARKTFKF